VRKATLIPLPPRGFLTDDEIAVRAANFQARMARRRTVRDFSARLVPREVIENCLRTAAGAPSGANLQPWHFVAVSDLALKHKIRIAAEAEEKEFYEHRAPNEWLEALAALGTDAQKPFLDKASWLIAIFAQPYRILSDGRKLKHYYATESVGIATGLLIAAVHQAGLVSLTHTPSPMGFLNKLLNRPAHEKAFLLLVVGHPAEDAMVPDIQRKSLAEISSFIVSP
jgi:iodotyrosine deiodinase